MHFMFGFFKSHMQLKQSFKLYVHSITAIILDRSARITQETCLNIHFGLKKHVIVLH